MSEQSFEDFMAERLAASTAFVEGDVQPLLDISATTSPATIYGPPGTIVAGAAEVNEANTHGAAMFSPGAENAFDVIHQAADAQLAYWTGVQRSTVSFKGHDEPVPMQLRVTEIFRRDDGAWKLIHRHADALKE